MLSVTGIERIGGGTGPAVLISITSNTVYSYLMDIWENTLR